MKYRVIAAVFALSYWLMPIVALAQDEDDSPIDARLQGYTSGSAALTNASGAALTWLLLFVLGALCVGVLFMNPKRSHLD